MTSNNIQKKYGGDFEFDKKLISNKENQFCSRFDNLLYFDTGRSALLNILNNIQCKKALLPNYICQSIIDVFKIMNIEIVFYNVKNDLTIDISNLKSKIRNDIDVIFFINYFAKIQPTIILNEIQKFSKNNNIKIVEDTTHSIFSKKSTIGDYCLASLRKWFAIPDCAIAYTNKYKIKDFSIDTYNKDYFVLRKKAMLLKAKAKNNCLEDESYLKYFELGESLIKNQNKIYKISDYSLDLLKHYDFEQIIQKRRENFIFLEKNIINSKIKPLINSCENNIPIFYPLLIKNRDIFKKYLFKHKIYCPVHWPIIQGFSTAEYQPWENQEDILSLIIDHRYNLEDMKFIANIINEYNYED